jgi:outer membrane protein insertion porin family
MMVTVVLYAILFMFAFMQQAGAEAQDVIGQVYLDVPDDVRDPGFLDAVRGLQARLPIKSGDKWEPEIIQESIRSLFRRGLFAQIEADTRHDNGKIHIRFKLTPITTISAVEFAGNDSIKGDDLRLAIHLRKGDAIYAENMDKARKRLIEFYRRYGFAAARVVVERQATTSPYENIVRFIIEEGDATRLEKIEFLGDPYFSQRKLSAHFPVRPGSRVTLANIFKAVRSLEEYYREQGFKEVRISVPDVEDDVLPGSALLTKGELRVHVQAGRKIRLRFIGNRRYGPNQVTAALKLDQERVLSYSWATLKKLSQNLSEFYQREGYLHVKITTGVELRGEREKIISFLIYEGKRVKLANVDFEGNDKLAAKTLRTELFAFIRSRLATEDDDSLKAPGPGEFDFSSRPEQEAGAPARAAWEVQPYTRPEKLNTDEIYIPALFDESARALEQVYREHGYLAARVSSPKTMFSATGQRLTLTYRIEEGVQTRVRSIRIAGVFSRSMEAILKMTGIRIGDPLNDTGFEEIEHAIKDAYAADGYLFAKVNLSYRLTPSQALADVSIEVYEGPLVTVGQILVNGLNKTKPIVVTQELSFAEGDTYKPSEMDDSQRWLQRLGIFQAATLKPWNAEKEEAVKDVVVTVTERPPGRFEISGGLATDDGVRTSTAFVYRNLFGRALEFHLRAKANYRISSFLDSQFAELYQDLSFGQALEREVGIGLFYPSILGSHISVRTELIHQREQERSYGMDKNSFVIGFGTELLRYFTVSQINEFAYVDVAETSLTAASNSEQALRPTSGTKWEYSPKLQGVFDYRDNMFDPTRGVTISLLFEYFETLTGTDNTDVFKTSGSVNGYIPIPITSRPWVLRLTLRSGYIKLVNGLDTPVEKRFKLGGRSSIRGFGEEAVYPAEQVGGPNPLPPSVGGDMLLLFKSDLRIPVYKNYYVGAFSDIGQLWLDSSNFDFDLGDYKKSAGAGIHYRTPVGDISLEIGWNLSPKKDLHEENWRLHFSISLF